MVVIETIVRDRECWNNVYELRYLDMGEYWDDLHFPYYPKISGRVARRELGEGKVVKLKGRRWNS